MNFIKNFFAKKAEAKKKSIDEIKASVLKIPFKYHPNVYDNEVVIYGSGVCDCCNKEVQAYCDSMYCRENVECICLDCIKSGAAAEKFNGTFSDLPEALVTDEAKTDELLKRTPGYANWQGESWKTCCDDYCAFLGDVGSKELDELGLFDEFVAPYARDEKEKEEIRNALKKIDEGSMVGYLFQCLHCGKYKYDTDCD